MRKIILDPTFSPSFLFNFNPSSSRRLYRDLSVDQNFDFQNFCGGTTPYQNQTCQICEVALFLICDFYQLPLLREKSQFSLIFFYFEGMFNSRIYVYRPVLVSFSISVICCFSVFWLVHLFFQLFVPPFQSVFALLCLKNSLDCLGDYFTHIFLMGYC